MLHSLASGIHGNENQLCDPVISEQTCYLCRRFNKTKSCLNILLDSCDYPDIYQFIHNEKLPYLGTVSSFCHVDNVLNEIYENRKCYNSITSSLRKCFNVLSDRTCSTVSKGFVCSTKISQAYCASLFSKREDHRRLSSLYLRTLEPAIDVQNCTDDSLVSVAQIYPEYEYRWKIPSTPQLLVRVETIHDSTTTSDTSTSAAISVTSDIGHILILCVAVALKLANH